MSARYLLVDVFARAPLEGNGLVVFPDPGSVEPSKMQKIAREMNLSETTFVTGYGTNDYDVRIFTPSDELPFAGHPTLGTAWVLRRHLGLLGEDEVIQKSAAGETRVTLDTEKVWLARTGSGGEDLDDVGEMLSLLGLSAKDVGFDAAEIGGRSTALRPAVTDIGVRQLMLPLASPDVVQSLRAPASVPYADGVYCVAPLGPVYQAGTLAGNPLDIEIEQGAEIARPSLISVHARDGSARVGGEVRLVAEATLHA